MKKYSAEEIRKIAAESGDEEIISRFEGYIESGLLIKERKPIGKFKPMLAIKTTVEKIKIFPIIAGLKYDGIRGILHPEFGLITRTSKHVPNVYISNILEALNLANLDGEIVTYTNGKKDDFNTVQSKVMTEDGQPDFKFIIFDDFEFPQMPYIDRLNNAARKIGKSDILEIAEYKIIRDKAALIAYEDYCANNSEGLIARRMDAPYKFGESTLKEAALMKIKRFLDDEGVILEVTQITNGLPMLGSLTVVWKKKLFNLGNGWTDEVAMEMWRLRHDLIGKKVTFRYQELGSKGAPRFSTFLGIRRDL